MRILLKLLLLGWLAQSPASEPSVPAPPIIPPASAPIFGNRVGQIDSLSITWSQRELRWNVIIRDRAVLSRIEKMRFSDWHGTVLLMDEHATTTRIGDEKYTGSIGVIKFAGRPFGFRIKVRNQPWALYVETGDAAIELSKLIEAEAIKQQPKK